MPWNYPYYQVARFAAPNLMLGNTIVLKHAETCPRSALAIQQIMDDAGVPAGVYNNVFASHEQISTIIEDPRIQGVSLTGSERAGAIIGEQAGRNLKKAVLELGGSDPYVILDSADIAADAATAWATRMENTGQACNSNKRMIVMEDIFDDFVGELTKLANDLVPGDPAKEEEGTFGPLSSRGAAEGLAEQVQDAVDKGATLHAGGTLHEGPGAYLAPTVLSGITKDMRAYYEELFGPVAVVYKVSSRRGSTRAGQRHPVRPGRRGVLHRSGPRRQGCRRPAVGHGQRQRAERRGSGNALRRGEALGLRPRAWPAGHGGVRQQAPLLRGRLTSRTPLMKRGCVRSPSGSARGLAFFASRLLGTGPGVRIRRPGPGGPGCAGPKRGPRVIRKPRRADLAVVP